MHVADCARIPRSIMSYLVKEDLVGTSADIRLLSIDDVMAIQAMYNEAHQGDEERRSIWSPMVVPRFKYMIEWFNSYHRTYGRAPTIQDMDTETFKTLPEEVESSIECTSFMLNTPMRPTSGVTFRRSSMMSQGTQAMSKRNVKVTQGTKNYRLAVFYTD